MAPLNLPSHFGFLCLSVQGGREEAIAAEVVSKVAAAVRDECQCGFWEESILEEELSCEGGDGPKAAVVFRAQIVQISLTGESNANELVTAIETWVASAEASELGGVVATVDQNCRTSFTLFSSGDCGGEGSDGDSDESSAILDNPTEKLIVGLVLGVCLLLLLVACVLIVMVACRRKRHSKLM